MSTSGPAARRNYDPSWNGISAYRYLLTDAFLRCADAIHDDVRYAAEVNRLRRISQRSIGRHEAAWKQLRDGEPEKPGFWINVDGKPLQVGERVPKEAYVGMEGAVMEVLHLDGLYWVQERKTTKSKDAYRGALAASNYADEEEAEA